MLSTLTATRANLHGFFSVCVPFPFFLPPSFFSPRPLIPISLFGLFGWLFGWSGILGTYTPELISYSDV
jgi:hypothetical protein